MKVRTSVRSLTLTLAGLGAGMVLSGVLSTPASAAHDHGGPLNPRIHHALDALHDARAELDAARNDFHGHKHDAEAAVDHAIDELDRIKDW